jgi:ferritin-like metal-binding protein YciE
MPNTLHDLFIDQLNDIHSAERQLVQALPQLAGKATDRALKDVLAKHLEETENHVARLDQVFESLGVRARGMKCLAMEGLIAEAQQIADTPGLSDDALCAGIVAAAQKVEHYEIATYGTLATWADAMGHTDAKRLLGETLEEEKAADATLTMCGTDINVAAAREAHPELAAKAGVHVAPGA